MERDGEQQKAGRGKCKSEINSEECIRRRRTGSAAVDAHSQPSAPRLFASRSHLWQSGQNRAEACAADECWKDHTRLLAALEDDDIRAREERATANADASGAEELAER